MIVHYAQFVGRVAACGLLLTFVPAFAADSSEPAVRYGLDPATGIVIAPRSIPVTQSTAAEQPAAGNEDAADADAPIINPLPKKAAAPGEAGQYRQVFDSIPFSRAEFDANPSYRHDAAMEMLTGNPRPKQVRIEQPAPPRPPIDYYPLNLPVMRHYFDMSRGPYSRYQHLFGYRGGYRPRFYRH